MDISLGYECPETYKSVVTTSPPNAVRTFQAKERRMHHPSALSNREPILDKLKQLLKSPGSVEIRAALEVGSGTGAHIEVFGE